MPREIAQFCSTTAHRLAGRWRRIAIAWAAAALTVMLPGADAKAAGVLADFAPIMPVMDCAAVAKLDFAGITDAKVTIQSATVATSGAPTPYCAVQGTIAPADIFVMRLPIQGWTQRYLQTGCGGLCGQASINYTQAATCAPIVDGSIASATTDMGHEGLNDGSWAANNPQAQIDFAYRGVHVTAQIAKWIITRFYGRQPAYFDGCSDGGREALMEAQRYPHDFDGIAAGAPANDLIVQNTFHHGWNVLANKSANGNYILLASKLPLIHSAVLAACDGLDGVVDGVIDDPRSCPFEPASLLCAAGQDPATCLTEAEAGVVRRLHDGATDASGQRLEQKISHEWGSELDWTLFVPSAQGQTTFSERIALSFLQYLAYFNVANPNYKLADLQFTVSSFWQTVKTSNYLAATDPDLSRFAGHGGKLLLWHGWSDQHITPQSTLEYYDAMRQTLGADTVERFAKLYLFPGVAHCGGGLGPNTFDVLTPLMAWVERGTPPGKIVASLVANGAVTRTRPVFPYPAVARYVGSGSTDDAANFVAHMPEKEPHVGYDWVGRPLYSHGYQETCHAVGTQLVCREDERP
jgi:tannase/feruloyl esterase